MGQTSVLQFASELGLPAELLLELVDRLLELAGPGAGAARAPVHPAQFVEHRPALRHLRGAEGGCDVRREQRGAVGRGHGGLHPKVRGLAGRPAVGGQEGRHAADHVGCAAAQVHPAVTVEVHGVPQDAAGHELRYADGAGVRTLLAQHVDGLLPAMQQVIFQFAAKIIGARRVVEGQRRQGIDDAEAAHVAAIHRFHPDDGDNDLLGHAIDLRGTLQRLGVLLVEPSARFDACGIDEARTVRLPGALRGLGGRRNGAQHARLRTHFRKQRHQFAPHESVALHHVADEDTHIFPACVALRHGGGQRTAPDQEQSRQPLHGLNLATSSRSRRAAAGSFCRP